MKTAGDIPDTVEVATEFSRARTKRQAISVRLFVTLSVILASPRLAASEVDTGATVLRIRVGLARVVRGPAANMADNRFSEIQLPNGHFRGFDAHNDTRIIDGNEPWDMSGTERTVLGPGARARTAHADNG